MGPRVSEGLGKPGGDGLATRSAFHPPNQCTYMCISTSRSRRFVSVRGGEETIEERPVADSRGSNGSTWFPAGNWVREVIGYTLFVADIKRDKLCKYFPVINEFLSKESRYSRMGFGRRILRGLNYFLWNKGKVGENVTLGWLVCLEEFEKGREDNI